jgi:flagellar motility protein MotE (MotC chaperone)
MKFLSKIRFLPVTIFFAVMMLTVKIDSIRDGIEEMNSPAFEVAGAEAQTDPGQTPPGIVEPPIDAEPAPDEAEIDEDTGESETEEEDATALLVTEDPTLLTTAEIELLQKLSARRKLLETREREMVMRSGLLSAAEVRIDKKIVELQILQETIDGLIKKFDAQQDAKVQSLVKIYENMKPKDAARIFEDLELETLLEVAERMKERKLAPIMAKMNPEKAREMTVELRQLRRMPATEEEVGG